MTTRIYVECDICHMEERRPRKSGNRFGLPDGWTHHAGDVPNVADADMHHCRGCVEKCVLC